MPVRQETLVPVAKALPLKLLDVPRAAYPLQIHPALFVFMKFAS